MVISRKRERTVDVLESTVPAALVKQARKVAAKGMVAYRKYCAEIGLEGRQKLSKINWRMRAIGMQRDDDMDVSLTDDQRRKRQKERVEKVARDEAAVARAEQWYQERRDSPERKKLKEHIKKIFKADVDAICNFTAQVIMDAKESTK